MAHPEVYHIALSKQEYHQLHQLIQAGNRLAHLYLGVNPICTEYFEWHRYLGELYPKLISLDEPAELTDEYPAPSTHKSLH